IDFEYFTHKSVFQEMLDFPNLILSYHNFEETPENLMEAFSEMTKLAPRVVKIAVMPQSEQDVLDLMNYTRGFKTLNPEQEFATISMGKLGRLSRFAGDVIGSSWTYVSLDHVSGPGQVTLNDMKRIIEVLEMDISN
ncbi:TPA: type I 3-dehydroquinate dehydratase, partial [Streptococcus pyogenes]